MHRNWGLRFMEADRELEAAILNSVNCPECGGGYTAHRGIRGDVCPECKGRRVSQWGAARRLRSFGYVCRPVGDHVTSMFACVVGGATLGVIAMIFYVMVMGGIP